ncbi:YHYH domain-containing protein [Paenibacillus mendelii]|uniref:YHYH domain-containing protein n=1 Tax=Paenibacillus mendelii TaxID=206163 RepID=A0ABV6JDM4_9BACL|nr:YHYH domain-containing protein [Paenibacillus mendelii]MCQ6563489.1 copper amine oxidase N-terminal domain-containing protein [Paenibacillus mendelii]
MRKRLLSFIATIIVVFMLIPLQAYAHSGRTDSSGGHNCSEKSQRKGLCTGYHYHNGGSAGSSNVSLSTSSNSENTNSYKSTKVKKTKVVLNEYPPYPHCKKVKDTSSSSNSYTLFYERTWDCNYYTDNGMKYDTLFSTLTIDGMYHSLDKSMISAQNSTYLYIKDFANIFGFAIEFDKSKNIVLKKGNLSLKIFNDTNKIFINGNFSGFKTLRIDGYSYIPLRFAVKLAGGTIDSSDSYTFNITT